MQNIFKLIAVVFTLTTTTLLAQSNESEINSDYSEWSIGLQLGVNTMRGDLGSFNLLKESNSGGYDFRIGVEPAFGINVTRMFNSMLGVRANTFLGTVSGNRDVENENQAFRARQFLGSVGLVVNLFDESLINADFISEKLSAHFLFDLGASHFGNYKLDDITGFTALELPNESGNLVSFFGAMGLEMNYRINDDFSISLGSIFRYYSSDKVDSRVSGKRNDMTMFSYIGVTYDFFK